MNEYTRRFGVVGNCVALNLRDSPENDPHNIKEVLKKDTRIEILDDVSADYFKVETPWKNQGFVLKKYIVDIKTIEKVSSGGQRKNGKHTPNDKETT